MRPRSSLAIAACLGVLAACSREAAKEPAPTSIEVRLGSSPSELVGARWPVKSDGEWFMGAFFEDLERVHVTWDGGDGFEAPTRLLALSQSNGFVQHAEITPLEHPLSFHQALQFVEDFAAAHGSSFEPDFAAKAAQWRLEDPVVKVTLHPNPIGPPTPTYSTDSRILRAMFPGGQQVEFTISNVTDLGWIVSVSAFKDLPEH